MKFNKYFIILLILCLFIFLNSVFAITNETNSDMIDSNETVEVSNNFQEVKSDKLEIAKNTSNNHTKYEEIHDELASSKKTKVKTKIIAKDITKYYGEKICIKAILKNSKNKGISKKKITITCDGKKYKAKTNSKGKIKLILNKGPGKYTIKFNFKHSGFKSSSKSITLQVKKMPTNIILTNNVFEYSESNKLKIYLKDKNNKCVANKKVIINFMNNKYEKTTDSKGIAILEFNAKPNDYPLLLSFDDETKNYESSKLNEKITVKSIPTNIEVNDLDYYYDNGTNNYLFATLKDIKNNKPLNSSIINFKINGKSISVKTDDNGLAGLQINEKPGIYTAQLSFSSSLYSNITKNITVNVISFYPSVNYDGGYYNISNLNLTLNVNNAKLIKYSWNNETWNYTTKALSYNLNNGIYDLYYAKENNNTIYHQHYVIDDESPLVWSNYNSDIYNSEISVNLSAWDYIDNNPKIYYTLNGQDPIAEGILYKNPLKINDTTTLKFYSVDFNNIKSGVITYNYMFNCKIANLNSGKTFNNVKSAIEDENTVNGDIIKISSGTYYNNLILNKQLSLIGDNNDSVIFIKEESSKPVIKITSNANNSIIHGITIKNSNYGVLLEKTENITLLYNKFDYCKNSIICYNDNNTLICNNEIKGRYLINMTGINSTYSNNMIISNNNISLNSNIFSIGILITGMGKNISIINNILTNKQTGRGIFIFAENIFMENNDISEFGSGVLINSFNSTFFNNKIHNNINGFDLLLSGFNTYKSNNIFNNNFGLTLMDSFIGAEDIFYLNRLYNNKYFDFYSDSDINYIINNNWWGTNNPTITDDDSTNSNIYDGKSTLIMDSWITMNSFASSYDLDENNIIKRAKIYLECNYNNLGQDLSILGYIPNNLNVSFTCDNINQNTLLNDGISYADFNLTDIFKINNTITITTKFDNQIISFSLNKKAFINTVVFSSAIDMSTGEKVNFEYNADYLNTTWITYSWAETGLYTGALNLIINGKIVKSVNITNDCYNKYKNQYRKEVFEVINEYNQMFASMKEGIWAPNFIYLNFALNKGLKITNIPIIEDAFLKDAKNNYKLTYNELEFIKNYSNDFVDKIQMIINYNGEIGKKINFNYGNKEKIIEMPKGSAVRISNIYYANIEDENSKSIGYEGMRSFAIAKTKVDSNNLKYWLNQKELYSSGIMKASYGTFLTSLLVMYENDNIATQAGEELNLTWNRISPICVSICNDFNCLYITGESDHTMGREAIGNESNVWKFNIISSLAFSLVEQLVGSNVWNDTTIGSVTLGLIQSFLYNETLESFKSNEFIFIKNAFGNSLLIIDMETGIVRDVFNYYGILGTMPCYHDNVTENAWRYGNKLLDNSTAEANDLRKIFNVGIIGSALIEGAELLGAGISGTAIGFGMILMLPVVMFLCPNEVNEAWKSFVYLLNPHYKDYPNIPIYENYPPEETPETPPILILEGKSLDDYIASEFKNNRYHSDNDKTLHKVNKFYKYSYKLGPIPDGKKPKELDNNHAREVGKYLKELYKNYKTAKSEGKLLTFIKEHFKELFAVSLYFESIDSINILIYVLINELSKENSTKT